MYHNDRSTDGQLMIYTYVHQAGVSGGHARHKLVNTDL